MNETFKVSGLNAKRDQLRRHLVQDGCFLQAKNIPSGADDVTFSASRVAAGLELTYYLRYTTYVQHLAALDALILPEITRSGPISKPGTNQVIEFS